MASLLGVAGLQEEVFRDCFPIGFGMEQLAGNM